ncbi:MAG: tetratricopeptide repeat protein [Actinomycetota bacterium]
METTLHTTRPRRVRTLAAVGLVALLLATAACGDDKTDAQLANETLQRGLTAHAAGDIPTAREAYRQTLTYDPTNAFALYNLGLLAQEDGDPELAEGFYRQAVDSDPDFTSALYNLAILRSDVGATAEAATLYQRVIELKPDYAPAHLNLGFALRDLGEKKAGNEQIAVAIELDPNLAQRIPGDVAGEVTKDTPQDPST